MSGAIVFEQLVQEDINIGVGQVDVTNPGGGTIRGTRVNLASLAFATYSQLVTPGAVAAGASASIAISLPGVTPGDFVLVSFPSAVLGPQVLIAAWINTADTVNVAIINNSGLAVNPGTVQLRVMVFKTNL